jgi:8-oxo-dGTP pyrophosphatase MutT (NUDIX family)
VLFASRGFRRALAGRYLFVSNVRLAATVILTRSPLEVYLTRRSGRSPFAPDAFVFPGGTVDVQDASTAALARAIGLEPQHLQAEFRATVPQSLASSEAAIDEISACALKIAAVRELFEEAGILLARDASGAPSEDSDSERLASERVALQRGELEFADFLREHDWFADTRALTLFSHWITPQSEPRRFNTHFFYSVAPPNQAPQADAHETHDGIWIAPARALERHRAGEMHLVYPTIKHLERLAAFDSTEDALTYARNKPVLTIMPADRGESFAIPPALENAW